MPHLVIFGQVFENKIVIYEISALEFVELQNFVIKQIFLNLEPKMPYLGIFRLQSFTKFETNSCFHVK